MLTGILSWILFGLVVGALAKIMMPGRDPGGIVVTILLGITGAVLGGWIGAVLGIDRQSPVGGWLLSILGAILLLVVYRIMTRGRSAPVV